MEASAKAPISPATAAFAFNLNNEDEEEQANEALFEKPLTPSDVGKLNRLVIPKQHAEKYFPMNGEKGLLLGFQDEAGQQWRFRYSYWNSSQSYVLTKGWSRFVKEKRLEAGDVVQFSRHPKEASRLFIGGRRMSGGGGQDGCVARGGGWSGYPYPSHQQQLSILAHPECPHAEKQRRQKKGNLKRLRLFGVNLEWDEDERESSIKQAQVQEDNCYGYYIF